MPEVLREYPTLVGGVDDRAFVAQIWGRETSGGRWEAWIVFVPITRGRRVLGIGRDVDLSAGRAQPLAAGPDLGRVSVSPCERRA